MISKLDFYPTRIKLLDSKPKHNLGLRALLVDNYTVIFIVNDDVVNIARDLYSASDFREKLFL